jgi:hypothetical protein
VHGPPESRVSVPVTPRRAVPAVVTGLPGSPGPAPPRVRTGPARDDGDVKTRTLLILALVTGLAIVAAGAIQIFLAR